MKSELPSPAKHKDLFGFFYIIQLASDVRGAEAAEGRSLNRMNSK